MAQFQNAPVLQLTVLGHHADLGEATQKVYLWFGLTKAVTLLVAVPLRTVTATSAPVGFRQYRR